MPYSLKLLVEWVPAAHLLTFSALTHLMRTKLVLRLTSELNPKKYEIFFDKLFDSLELLIQLTPMVIYVVGTLSKDVTRVCPLTTGSAMRKDGCGTMSQFVEKKVGLLSILGPITEELYSYLIFLVKIQFLEQIALIVDTAR